ncbi:hypothetical protein PRMUPPPA20_08070 [Xylanibacter ruminicola]|jgi:hypothetical protein|nr:hypothetical protein PRMUPPPA20_08070 [Xylanibacter ruminicola]SDQ54603.1 Transglycosylase SLT domain-containing protein [Prevotella sp. khp1]SEH96025.1 Transglycosylase SLT domain-containing protein [Xylanibacter ruminicola]SFC43238.1 Transglycosylase SLT domain-containing protein [Xylanibacter ruminicola]SHM57349.1 Transglycosylase SLT domain-containing protein [Xylanibacter ruminicola]
MIGFIKKAVLSLMALFLVTLSVSAEGFGTRSNKTLGFDWNPVMDAIIKVESEGNPKAVSGNSVGAMQITPVLVKECNNILSKRKSKKRYTLADRYSVEKSKEMFLLIQSYFNPENSVEKAIRSWNGGMNYGIKTTNSYYRKVIARMKK